MMINKRLIGTVGESKKYIAGNVAFQWLSLAANIVMMDSITRLLAALFENTASEKDVWLTLLAAAAAVAMRYLCTRMASRMSYLSSKAVKKTLRGLIYQKLLRLGASYQEQAGTSEVVQVAVEGVDQLADLLRRLSAAVFLRHARAADAVCRSRALSICPAPRLRCSSACR